MCSIKILRNSGFRPNLEKDENYENNKSYLLKGQRVYDPQNGINIHKYIWEVEYHQKLSNMTFEDFIYQKMGEIVSKEDDEYGMRDEFLFEAFETITEDYKKHVDYHTKQKERAQAIVELIEFTKKCKYIKGVSNGSLIVFDLERDNGEWK